MGATVRDSWSYIHPRLFRTTRPSNPRSSKSVLEPRPSTYTGMPARSAADKAAQACCLVDTSAKYLAGPPIPCAVSAPAG